MTASSSRASREAHFCIGSNCGDRKGSVATALVWLSGKLYDFRHSSIYATPDCHGGQREYLNAVCSGYTTLSPRELETLTKDFEKACGRNAAARAAGDVPVDVDLVMFDGEILRKKDFCSEFFKAGYRELGS